MIKGSLINLLELVVKTFNMYTTYNNNEIKIGDKNFKLTLYCYVNLSNVLQLFIKMNSANLFLYNKVDVNFTAKIFLVLVFTVIYFNCKSIKQL